MKKNTKLLLIVAVIAGGYFYWKSRNPSARHYSPSYGAAGPYDSIQ